MENKNKSKVESFFKLIESGNISNLEIYNKIEKLTNKYEIVKLQFLVKDLVFYIEQKIILSEFKIDDFDSMSNQIFLFDDPSKKVPPGFIFLQDFKRMLGYLIEREFKLKETQNQPIVDNYDDNVDDSNINAKEKLILLKFLGVIDYLKDKDPFKSSTNKLSEIISKITDIKYDTTKSYVNAMVSPSTNSEHNNPMKSNKGVSNIKKLLEKIDFTITK